MMVDEHTHHSEGGALWMTAFTKSLEVCLAVQDLGKARVVQPEGKSLPVPVFCMKSVFCRKSA